MIVWLEDIGGHPIAFLHGKYIHAPTGRVIGFVDGNIARRIYGEAVGIVHAGMLYDPNAPGRDMIAALTTPLRVTPRDMSTCAHFLMSTAKPAQ